MIATEDEISIQNKAEAELIEQIKASYNASIALAENAKNAANSAVEEAVKCGNYLISAKASVGHGRWKTWFQTNIAHVTYLGFSYETATRYMRLAEFVNAGGSIDDGHGMRKAFIAAGILIEGTREAGSQQSHGSAIKWLSFLQKARGDIERLEEHAPIEAWPDNDLVVLNEQAQRFSDLHARTHRELERRGV